MCFKLVTISFILLIQDSTGYARDGVRNMLEQTKSKQKIFDETWISHEDKLRSNIELCQFYNDLNKV